MQTFNLFLFAENDCSDDVSVDVLNQDEAVTFNAKKHLNFIEENLSWVGVNNDEWEMCQKIDRAAINLRISVLCGFPSAYCKNHGF